MGRFHRLRSRKSSSFVVGIYVIAHVCWSVRSLATVFFFTSDASACDFSKSAGPIFMKFGIQVQPNFTGNFLEVKVNVQGQNHCTEN